MTGSVTFVSAGPGAPGLLTLDAVDALRTADRVLYADSLVSPEIGQFVRPGVPFEGTKERHLEDICAEMIAAAERGEHVARVHSGDTALYGAITEQIALLRAAHVPYRIIAGVSSVFAAAAALGVELTVPGIAQTIIMTRAAGRTGMPAGEDLPSLAAHGTSLAILLGITRINQLVADLLAGGYAPDTPVAALYRVSWPDEAIVRGTLETIAEQVRRAKWSRQALVMVGRALDPGLQDGTHRSHLYDSTYTHRFRRADHVPIVDEITATEYVATPTAPVSRLPLAVVSLTKGGTALGARLAPALGGTFFAPARFADDTATAYTSPVADLIRDLWHTTDRLLLIMPVGVAVRSVAPLLEDKTTDPGIVALDEAGMWAVAVAGGHRGGANDLARAVAAITGGDAVVTTASDVQGVPALDLLGKDDGWTIANPEMLTQAAAALVNGDPVACYQEAGSRDWVSHPEAAALRFVPDLAAVENATYPVALVITARDAATLPEVIQAKSVIYHPPCLAVGVGCARGVPAEAIAAAVEGVLREHGLAPAAIRSLASIDVKADEAGLLGYADRIGVPIHFFPADALNGVAVPSFSPAAMKAVGAQGVAEPAALLAAGVADLRVPKQIRGQVTVAVAVEEWRNG